MRVAVTGAAGRLGRALLAALGEAAFTGFLGPLAWRRPEFDLDVPSGFAGLLDRDWPDVIVHAAAWTDVDECAREPDLARWRNSDAVGALATECAERGVDLVVVSTNEVFDGRRRDGQGYGPDDPPGPINPYGASKLGGEREATSAFAGVSAQLAIVRTAWLYGPPGSDFPSKILAAAERALRAGQALRLVSDEVGSPTYAPDLAEAIVELLGSGSFAGVHHVVNDGVATRAEWAREVLRLAGVEVATEDVPASTWQRPSTPPLWGVLAPTPLPSGEPLRPWQEALADYMAELPRTRAR